ncbi:MAG TPA: enoyl-CoA hydratase/isomerase family protein [Acidimicrobiales bacterium]|nr:enoyl-CoA hydratase/isomerase family protein [Acidimicrobiales bacterium]
MTAPGWSRGFVAVEVDLAGPVAWVVLDRPDAANARNQAMREELQATWAALADDDAVAAVVLTGAGDRFFCAGMDLKEAGQPETPGARRDRLRGSRDIEQLARLPKPTVAAVNGYALGGGLEMALACDLRLVAEGAQVGLTELDHGLVPGGGGTQRLPRLIGYARAAELLFLGRRLTGEEAVAWGIANRCVPAADLREAAADLAGAIAAKPSRALRYAKELLQKSQELPPAAGVEAELDVLLTLLADRQGPDTG